MNDDMLALAARVEARHGFDNSLDVEIEVALFEPGGIAVSARPNAFGTKVIYTYVDGTQATYWAEEWTADRADAAASLRARASMGGE